MNMNLKKILVTGVSLLMLASVGAGVNSVANADGTNAHVTWYHTPRLTKKHMHEITSVKFYRHTAGGLGTYAVTLRNGEQVWCTPESPFGRQLRSSRWGHHHARYHAHKHYRHHNHRHARKY